MLKFIEDLLGKEAMVRNPTTQDESSMFLRDKLRENGFKEIDQILEMTL